MKNILVYLGVYAVSFILGYLAGRLIRRRW